MVESYCFGQGGVFLFLILVIVSSPLWFPWILKPVAQRYGADFKSFERVGYERLILSNVSFARRGTTFLKSQVEILQPLSWLWRRQQGDTTTDRVTVKDWQLAFAGGTTNATKIVGGFDFQ